MKGSEQVIAVLNQVLRKELTGINQGAHSLPRGRPQYLGL
jgi:bacterioferritin (cytochrome b1)